MDLRHPLGSLVPSLDSAVLEVLVGTQSTLGTSQISRLAGQGSRTGHQKVLDRLVEHGLVLSEPTNNGFTYRLNRDHLLTPAVLMAVGARRELLTRLAGIVTTLDPQPQHASVFGSLSRGEGTVDSDIDLFLVMPEGYDEDEEHWESELQRLEELALAWTGNRLEALVLTPTSLAVAVKNKEPVLDSLRTDAIRLHGPEVTDLLNRARA